MTHIRCSAGGIDQDIRLQHDGGRDYGVVLNADTKPVILVQYVAESLDEAVQQAVYDGFEFDRIPFGWGSV